MATIHANGGNVSLSAAFAATGTSGGNDRAIELDFASIKTSGSGTITLNGNASANGNTTSTSTWGIGLNTVTAGSSTLIQSENGAITLTGTAGKASASASGIANSGSAVSILSASGAITLNDIRPSGSTGTYAGLSLKPSSTASIYIGSDGTTVPSSSSNVTINADAATFAANGSYGTQINTSGTVTLQPYGNDFVAALDATNLALASSVTGFTIGKPATSADGTADADVTIGRATSIDGPIGIYGKNIAINAGLMTTAFLDSNAVITLKGSGNVTDGASGFVQAGSQTTLGQRTGSLLLLGGNVTLDNSVNNDVGFMAASGVSGLTYLDYAGMIIGTVGSTSGVSATGVVNIGTKLYSLAIEKDVTTTNASANALTLNASMDSAVGADLSSNILIRGTPSYTPTISVGSGGIGRLYTGGITTDSQKVSQLSGFSPLTARTYKVPTARPCVSTAATH